MVEISRIEMGVARYLDAELVNKLPGNTWKQFGAGMASGLIAKRGGVALGQAWFDWQPPGNLDSRALQARVFVIGLLISLVLRFAPKGLLPEQVRHHG